MGRITNLILEYCALLAPSVVAPYNSTRAMRADPIGKVRRDKGGIGESLKPNMVAETVENFGVELSVTDQAVWHVMNSAANKGREAVMSSPDSGPSPVGAF